MTRGWIVSKVDIKELEKAIAYIKKSDIAGEIDISFDPFNRLLIKTSHPLSGDQITIIIYPDNNKMADIEIRSRL